MKIASAQINCTVGKIQQNLTMHYQIIELAIKEKVELIAFPELSITGYCREEASELAFTENDDRLEKLKKLSIKGNIKIIVGAPILIKNKVYIGSFIIYPNKPIDIYTKQYLHGDEKLSYESSIDYNPILSIENEKISLAICADINNENHPFQAKKNNSTLYIPSIFFTDNEMSRCYEQLSKYAEQFSLNILMSNYTGQLWDMTSGGKSAFWNSKGTLIGNLGTTDSGILIVEKKNEKWSTKNVLITQ